MSINLINLVGFIDEQALIQIHDEGIPIYIMTMRLLDESHKDQSCFDCIELEIFARDVEFNPEFTKNVDLFAITGTLKIVSIYDSITNILLEEKPVVIVSEINLIGINRVNKHFNTHYEPIEDRQLYDSESYDFSEEDQFLDDSAFEYLDYGYIGDMSSDYAPRLWRANQSINEIISTVEREHSYSNDWYDDDDMMFVYEENCPFDEDNEEFDDRFHDEVISFLRGQEEADAAIDKAGDPVTPPEILVDLSKYEALSPLVAGNPNTPTEILFQLYEDDRNHKHLSCNPKTPQELLAQLSISSNQEVRFRVAYNQNTPVNTLIELSKDEDDFVRSCVAENPNTPMDVLLQLCEDKSADNHETLLAISKIASIPANIRLDAEKALKDIEAGLTIVKARSVDVDILFERLRLVRKNLADKMEFPPYVIFSNDTLNQIAEQQPTTHSDFSNISGINQTKIEKYADDFISIILEHQKIYLQTEITEIVTSKLSNLTPHSATFEMYTNGLEVDEIAQKLGLKSTTIWTHLLEILEAGYSINIDRLVPSKHQNVIYEALEMIGSDSLRTLFEHLREEYTYDEIKIVRAVWQNQRIPF
ncbi:MAG: helix-turn-helix domain-containing protein [Pseudanabaena sp. M57BS1SP1A06MG]|nr:helix-turn-helix domain-containing protein [Pseudanabaena sp. M57BS1SP1A06MG]